MQLLRQNVFILIVFILIQLCGTANAMDINTDYYITNSTLASRHHGSVEKENSLKIRRFEHGQGRMFLKNYFVH